MIKEVAQKYYSRSLCERLELLASASPSTVGSLKHASRQKQEIDIDGTSEAVEIAYRSLQQSISASPFLLKRITLSIWEGSVQRYFPSTNVGLIVTGDTGTGKTSLLKALMRAFSKSWSFYTCSSDLVGVNR
jgi:ABC-type uncharacterized transport system fused permease/ATPase subunit